MKFLEKNLEDIVFETKNELLRQRGLPIYGKKLRQVKIGNYGVADLITLSRVPEDYKLIITVYELKKDVIGASAFFQAIRYCRGIQDYYEYFKYEDYSIELNIVLIGSDIDKSSDFIYLPDVINSSDFYVHFLTYNYKFDGIYFDEHSGYVLKNKGFENGSI